jgi:protein SCO1/2
MRRTNNNRSAWSLPLLALCVALLLGGTSLAENGLIPNSVPDETNPRVGYDQKLGEKIPLDLTFTDENGNEVTIGQCMDGKPSIIILAWYQCPMLCGEVLTGVMDAARKMRLTCGKDFNIVTVSIDTKEPAKLAHGKKMHFVTEYGRKEADKGWKFLTTKNQDHIDQLAASVGFRYEWDKMLKEFKHPSGIVIVTPEGVISRYFPGIEYLDRGEAGQLLEDQTKTLRLSLVEAGEGKIGTFSDRVFLSCYRFDPHRGKYSLGIMWMMRAGGLLTLLIIAGIYARVAWKLPGARLMVVGVLIYALLLLPVIMFTSVSIDWMPRWAAKAAIVPVGVVVFFIGRWIWRSAKVSGGETTAPPVPSV